MRRWIWITALVLLGIVLGGLLLASPLAERRVRAEAEARGLVLTMEDFRLGWFEAELTGVEVSLEGVAQVDVKIDRILVDLTLGEPRLRRVLAEDGTVSITGEVEVVKAALEKWRSSRPQPDAPQAKGTKRTRSDFAKNFEVTWENALGKHKTQTISGLQLERTPDGDRLGADLMELYLGDLEAQIAGAELQLEEGLLVRTATATEMRVNWLASLPAPNSEEPETDLAATDDDDEGLGDRLEQDTGRVARLLAGLNFIRERALPRIPQESKVDKLWVTYKRGHESLHVGPSLLTMTTKGEELFLGVAPQGNSKGTPLSLTLTVHAKAAPQAASFSVKGGPVALSTLGVEEGAFGLNGVAQTTLSGDFEAKLSSDAKTITGGGSAIIEGLSVDNVRLATSLVSFPKLKLSGQGEMQVDGSRYKLTEGSIRMGETNFNAAFDIERGEDFVALRASAQAPLVSCQALLDSAPRGLLGAAEQMRFDGTFSLEAGVEADTRELSKMKVRWDFKNGCRVKAVPAELDPERFRTLFRREVIGAGNFPIQLDFGPHSTSWVPYDEVSPFMEKALLVTEDGRFFRHDGFDDRAIESAIRDNVRKGQFVRGASTISMQLAKNLYLSRRKTLARKFQEAALTSLLEQSFAKRELLELYVNIVEFGPGIYGIRQAAEHYFSTVPGRLSAAQAFFLASVLPAPTREYFQPSGELKEERLKYVHHLLSISHKRDALTDDQLEEALKEELIFGRAETRPEGQELEEGAAEGEGSDEQTDDPRPHLDPSVENEPVFPLSGKQRKKDP